MSRAVESSRIRRWFQWWMIPLLLLTFWLGARGLDADPIWFDEYYSIHDAGGAFDGPRSPAQIWTRLAERNPWHTPGFFILLSGWGAVVGWEPPGLRLFALLFGMLAVAWLYRLGRDTVSPQAGLYAAVLLGTSAFLVYYLHEIRMYAPIVTLTIIMVWCYFKIIDFQARWWHWLGLFAATLTLLYLHYFAALPIAALGLYHLLFAPKNRTWVYVTGLMLLAGLLFLPWVRTLLDGLQLVVTDDDLQGRALDNRELIPRVAYLFSNGAAIVLLVVGIFALYRPGRTGRRIGFMLAALLGLASVANAVLQIIPETRLRYLISLLPLLTLLLGIGIERIGQLPTIGRIAPPLIIAAWIGLGIYNSTDAKFLSDLGGSDYVFPMQVAARQLRHDAQPDDFLLNYMRESTPSSKRSTRFYLRDVPVSFQNLDPREIVAPERFAELDNHERVWIAYTPLEFDNLPDLFVEPFRLNFASCGTTIDTDSLHLELFGRLPLCCSTPGETLVAEFGDGIVLEGVAPLPEIVGNALPVSLLWWVSDDLLDYQYSVGLKILNQDNFPVTELDYGLPVLPYTCQQNQIELGELPAGEYTLAATVYAWETGERLPGILMADDESGELLPLKTFRIDAS